MAVGFIILQGFDISNVKDRRTGMKYSIKSYFGAHHEG